MGPWEKSYKRTKAIKTGAASLEPPFSDLVDWVNEFYPGVGALDAWVETRPGHVVAGKSALRVVLERDAGAERFMHGANFNRSEQQRVLAKFRSLGPHSRYYDTERMVATFQSFEDTARWEANSAVGEGDLVALAIGLRHAGLWVAHPQFGCVTFLFFTDDQLSKSEANGARKACEAAYAKVLRPYDEFGYFADRPIQAFYSSKETFDRDYNGNWFFFDR